MTRRATLIKLFWKHYTLFSRITFYVIQCLLLPTLTRGRGQGEINFLSDYDELQPSRKYSRNFIQYLSGTSRGRKSPDSYHTRTSVVICFPNTSVEKRQRQQERPCSKGLSFHLYFIARKKNSSDIKSLLQIHIRHQINTAFFARGSLAILKNNGRAIK